MISKGICMFIKRRSGINLNTLSLQLAEITGVLFISGRCRSSEMTV